VSCSCSGRRDRCCGCCCCYCHLCCCCILVADPAPTSPHAPAVGLRDGIVRTDAAWAHKHCTVSRVRRHRRRSRCVSCRGVVTQLRCAVSAVVSGLWCSVGVIRPVNQAVEFTGARDVGRALHSNAGGARPRCDGSVFHTRQHVTPVGVKRRDHQDVGLGVRVGCRTRPRPPLTVTVTSLLLSCLCFCHVSVTVTSLFLSRLCLCHVSVTVNALSPPIVVVVRPITVTRGVACSFCTKTLSGHGEWVRKVVCNDNGSLAASCSNDAVSSSSDGSCPALRTRALCRAHVPCVSHTCLTTIGVEPVADCHRVVAA
jgi:hypothetical protein